MNIDDFTPCSKPDFGGIDGTVLARLIALNVDYGTKFTLFTTPNWLDRPHDLPMRIMRRFGARFKLRDDPFRLDKHEKWCDIVRGGVEKGIWELAVHGCTHFNTKSGLHQQEFINLSHREAVSRLERAMEIFVLAKLPFVKVFRPAGFGFNENTITALESCGFEAIAPFPSWYRNTEFSMGKLRVLPQGENDLKFHTAYRYGCETIHNGLESEEVFSGLLAKVKDFKKQGIRPSFFSEKY